MPAKDSEGKEREEEEGGFRVGGKTGATEEEEEEEEEAVTIFLFPFFGFFWGGKACVRVPFYGVSSSIGLKGRPRSEKRRSLSITRETIRTEAIYTVYRIYTHYQPENS